MLSEDNKECISVKDFKVGEIAYIIRDRNCPYYAYPVKVLKVGRTKITTTAPPFNIKFTGCNRRNKFVFRENSWSFYSESERYEKTAKSLSEILSKTCFALDNQYCCITVLLPSINHVRALNKYMLNKEFEIEDCQYSVFDENFCHKKGYNDTEDDIRFCLISYLGKTGEKVQDVADKLGVTSQQLNDFIQYKPTIIGYKFQMEDLKNILIGFGYDFKKDK